MSNIKKSCYKIALVGTACVGKTSILEILHRKYKNTLGFGFIEETPRAFFTEHPNITNRFSFEVQTKILNLVLAYEAKAEKRANVILCDRSIIDPIVYMRVLGDKAIAAELLEKVAPHLNNYQKVFLLDPAGVPYQTDTIRNEAEETRQQLHAGFVEFLKERVIPYTLLSGSLHERLNIVERSLLENL